MTKANETTKTTGITTFDIADIDTVISARGNGNSAYSLGRKMIEEALADKTSKQGILMKDIVHAVRKEIKAAGDEDPGYQGVSAPIRNFVTNNKKYRLVKSSNNLSFIFKKDPEDTPKVTTAPKDVKKDAIPELDKLVK